MAKYSVPNYVTLLNEQIEVSQLLSEYHDSADALLDIALADNFFQKDPLTLHLFFCDVSNKIKQVKKLNFDSLDFLLRIMSIIANNDGNTPPPSVSLH
jgi:hypothetical protein